MTQFLKKKAASRKKTVYLLQFLLTSEKELHMYYKTAALTPVFDS